MQDLLREFDIKFVHLPKNPKKNNNIKFLNEGSALIRKGEEKSTHLEILK